MRRAADLTLLWNFGARPAATDSVSGRKIMVTGEVDDFKFAASYSGAIGAYSFAIGSAP